VAPSARITPRATRTRVALGTLQRSTISWYEIDCKILQIKQTPNGISIRTRCVKGGGAHAPATINIKRINEKSLNISVAGIDKINDVFFGGRSISLKSCVEPSRSK
jgi:hypothetical protein